MFWEWQLPPPLHWNLLTETKKEKDECGQVKESIKGRKKVTNKNKKKEYSNLWKGII